MSKKNSKYTFETIPKPYRAIFAMERMNEFIRNGLVKRDHSGWKLDDSIVAEVATFSEQNLVLLNGIDHDGQVTLRFVTPEISKMIEEQAKQTGCKYINLRQS